MMLLLALLLATQPNAWSTVLQIVLLGGILLWIFGRPAVHVGASGLIYGLIAYLMAAGFAKADSDPHWPLCSLDSSTAVPSSQASCRRLVPTSPGTGT